MTRTARRAIAIFVLMMVAMALLGAINQSRLGRYHDLLERKSELIIERGALRARAERIRGPHAVSSWARSHGMVPALENPAVLQVGALPGPPLPEFPSGLEVDTRWR